jgi:sugar O-acyltransferase (sialic acid O-acetyltransferase NeuD family)
VKKIGIIGFGALGRQVLGLLTDARRPDHVIFFDDILHGKRGENSFPFDSFLDAQFAEYDFYSGLGYQHLPRKIEVLQQLLTANRRVPSFVHPTSHIHATARMSEGCLVYPLCNVDQEVVLGCGVLLNNSVVVSHNSQIGDAAYLSPGVVLSGHVTVGQGAFLGSGVLVANNRRIGDHARIGIGSVVTSDVPAKTSAIGNPIRLLKQPLKLE